MLWATLTVAIVSADYLSPQQHGFRKGHSTIDTIKEVIETVWRENIHNHWSCRVVLPFTLDDHNAFNFARWIDMLWALPHTSIPFVNYWFVPKETCTQESALGPDLKYVSYDSIWEPKFPYRPAQLTVPMMWLHWLQWRTMRNFNSG